jgi:hypothetical protein
VYQHENQYRLDEIKLPNDAKTVENKADQILDIPFNALTSGMYALIIEAKDKYGTPIRYEKECFVYNEKEAKTAQNEMFYAVPVQTSGLKPNENAKILIGSALSDAVVEFQI